MREDLEEYAEETGKHLNYEEEEGTFTASFMSPKDIFRWFGGSWVPDVCKDLKFVVKDCMQEGGKAEASTSVAKDSPRPQAMPSGLEKVAAFVKLHFNDDMNARGNGLLGFCNNEKARDAYERVSKSWRRSFVSVVQPKYEGPVAEVLEILAKKIECTQPTLIPYKYEIAGGALMRGKNIFSHFQGIITRVGNE
jgi:hypothetical protein